MNSYIAEVLEVVARRNAGEPEFLQAPPKLPPEVIENTRAKYLQALKALTGEGLH